jgi:phospholipid/cholesterol/gamma-HCH transport system substrate-binding protein
MPDPSHNYRWTLEFKVGLMTLSALLTLMVALLFINNFQFGTGGRVVTVSFNFLGDLKTNAPVEYAGGIKVGIVKDIRVGDNKALVDLLITNKDLKLRKDSQIDLYSAGLLGSRYVQIGADLGTGPELEKDETLVGKDSNNLDLTFSELGDVLESFEKMMGDPKAKENFLHSFENMNKATDQMLALTIASRAKVDKIIDQLSKSSNDVPLIVSSAQKVSKNLEDLTGAMNKKDINQSMKDLTHTLKVMNELASDIHDGKGVIGVLMKDEKMAEDIKALVEELKAHPWKLLWKK